MTAFGTEKSPAVNFQLNVLLIILSSNNTRVVYTAYLHWVECRNNKSLIVDVILVWAS